MAPQELEPQQKSQSSFFDSTTLVVSATSPILEKMIVETKEDLRGLIDRELLLLAHDSLCGRSELASLGLDDIGYDKSMNPISTRLKRSKADQEAIGKIVRATIRTLESTKDGLNTQIYVRD